MSSLSIGTRKKSQQKNNNQGRERDETRFSFSYCRSFSFKLNKKINIITQVAEVVRKKYIAKARLFKNTKKLKNSSVKVVCVLRETFGGNKKILGKVEVR